MRVTVRASRNGHLSREYNHSSETIINRQRTITEAYKVAEMLLFGIEDFSFALPLAKRAARCDITKQTPDPPRPQIDDNPSSRATES